VVHHPHRAVNLHRRCVNGARVYETHAGHRGFQFGYTLFEVRLRLFGRMVLRVL
jgi:hypothetical protein